MAFFYRSSLRPIFALLFIGYLFLYFCFPLLPHYTHYPLADIRTLAPSLLEGVLYGLGFVGLYGLYGLAYRRVQQMEKPPKLGWIVGTAVFFILPLLFTFPINSTDVYRYVIRGRVSSVYGQSPYVSPPSAFPDDPFVLLAGEWADETSPYGPAWELTAAAVTALSQGSLWWGLLAFKGVGGIFHLGSAVLLWQLLHKLPPAEQSARTLLWAWNPSLLLFFVMDAHNDVMMIFWLLAGWWMLENGRFLPGTLLLLLAPLTKPIGLLALPFLILPWLLTQNQGKDLPQRTQRAQREKRNVIVHLLVAGIAGMGLIGLVFLPFGSPFNLVLRLAREATDGAGFSIGALLILLNQTFQLPFSFHFIANLSMMLFIAVAIWLLWRAWRGREAVRETADIFFAYTLQALNFRIWYATWPFPWLLLDNTSSAYRLRVGLYFLLTAQLSVLIYGHFRVFLLGGSHLWTHLIGIPFVFGLPFLLAHLKSSHQSSVISHQSSITPH